MSHRPLVWPLIRYVGAGSALHHQHKAALLPLTVSGGGARREHTRYQGWPMANNQFSAGMRACQGRRGGGAGILFEKKKIQKAKFLFQRNLIFNPKDSKSYLYLAKIYFAEAPTENASPAKCLISKLYISQRRPLRMPRLRNSRFRNYIFGGGLYMTLGPKLYIFSVFSPRICSVSYTHLTLPTIYSV